MAMNYFKTEICDENERMKEEGRTTTEGNSTHRWLRARRALTLFIDVPLRTRKVLSPSTDDTKDNTDYILNGSYITLDTRSRLNRLTINFVMVKSI